MQSKFDRMINADKIAGKKSGFNFIEPMIHILIWITFYLIVIDQVRTIGPFRQQDGTIYLLLAWSTLFNLFLFYFNALFLVPRLIAKKRYTFYILSVIGLYGLVVLGNTVVDHLYAISLFSTEKEPLFAEFTLNTGNKLMILSLSLGYGFTKNWLLNEKARQQLAREKLAAELKYLKAQTNPHFLFNTLNLAYSSAVKNNDQATADIIEKLSGLMRYGLYECNEEKVPLEKEIGYIDSYINLQLQRLSPEIRNQVSYKLEGEWKNLKIAPMLLIPFVENVFKHGVILSRKPEIEIYISVNEGTLTLITRNTKGVSKITPAKPGPGIGLQNVSDRLNLLYPSRYVLEIDELETTFEVKMKLKL